MKQINICPRCGGELQFIELNNNYKCAHCGSFFEEEKISDIEEKINLLLDEFKQEQIANARRQLWNALHEKHISSERILDITRIIKTYLPDDFMANFFEFVNTKSNTQEQINEYINNIDVKENYIYIDVVLDFMIRSLESSNLLSLNNLIENTYKNIDLKLYNDYTTKLSEEAEKVKSGVYDLSIERDVFVAYSSKDIKYVEEVVKLLNQEGISYFVALENLRHGKGAVENYDKALEQAIENSKTFLFISSENSRTRECDALKKEIPYLKKLDKLNAPAKYRNDYAKIPPEYKKPRVQLLIGKKPKGTVADKQVAEVFDGYEWRYDAESAVEAICKILDEEIIEEKEKKNNVIVVNRKTKFVIFSSIIGVIALAFIAIIIGISISNSNFSTSNSANQESYSADTKNNTEDETKTNTETEKVIEILYGNPGLQMCVDDTYILPVRSNYEIPEGSDIKYDDTIISFDRDNLEIKALKSGNTEFYVKDVNGVKSNVIKIYVFKIEYEYEGESVAVNNKKSGTVTAKAIVKNPKFVLQENIITNLNNPSASVWKLNFECDITMTYGTKENFRLLFQFYDKNEQMVGKFSFDSPNLILNEEKHIVVTSINSSVIKSISLENEVITAKIYSATSS